MVGVFRYGGEVHGYAMRNSPIIGKRERSKISLFNRRVSFIELSYYCIG